MSRDTFRDSLGVLCAGELLVLGKRAHQVAFTFEAEWVPLLSRERRGAAAGAVTASHRSTTSSRRPGVAITGTVWTRNKRVVPCPKCNRPRMDLGGPHSPQVHSDGSQTDCCGDVVVPARAVAA